MTGHLFLSLNACSESHSLNDNTSQLHDYPTLESLTLEQEYGPRLIELGSPVWKTQADALERASYMRPPRITSFGGTKAPSTAASAPTKQPSPTAAESKPGRFSCILQGLPESGHTDLEITENSWWW